jgi:hypothetical protein
MAEQPTAKSQQPSAAAQRRLRWFEIEVTGLGYRPMRELMRATTGSAARKAAQAKYGSSAVVALVGQHERRLLLNRSSPDPRRRSITAAHQSAQWKPPTGSSAFSNLQASN